MNYGNSLGGLLGTVIVLDVLGNLIPRKKKKKESKKDIPLENIGGLP